MFVIACSRQTGFKHNYFLDSRYTILFLMFKDSACLLNDPVFYHILLIRPPVHQHYTAQWNRKLDFSLIAAASSKLDPIKMRT